MPNFADDVTTLALYHFLESAQTVNGVTQNEVWVTYGRDYYFNNLAASPFEKRAQDMVGGGFLNNASMLVVGCGFGFLIERLIAAGIDLTNIWGIDPGPFYWDPARDSEWDPTIKPRVANDWLGSGTEVASLQALPGITGQARFTFIIDEDAATMHSDAELPAFIAACEARLQGNAKGRIWHLVSTGTTGDTSVNWKSLADWKAVAPDHNWMDIGTGEVAP